MRENTDQKKRRVPTLSHKPACASFLNFIILCRCFVFFISVSFVFFTALLLSIQCKQLSSCFHFFDRSRVSLSLIFDNLSKNLIIYPQQLDFLMISNLQFPRLLKFKPHSSVYTHDYPNTLFSETQDKDFSLRLT